MKKVAVTGTTGFLGKALVQQQERNQSVEVFSMCRKTSHESEIKLDLSKHFDVVQELSERQVEVIIHCAARAHILNDEASSPLEEYRKVNTTATIELAKQAAAAGVKRFIFISSAKVNGEVSTAGHALDEHVTKAPTDHYALSKYEAELALIQISEESGMEVVIIRPPLVYGAEVKANFASLMKLSRFGLPLPFGAINNARSLISIDNLCDAINLCITHPLAANQTFLVSDDEDVSTTQLLRALVKAYESRTLLVPIPVKLLKILLQMVGKPMIAERLFSNLQFDICHIKQTLNWVPPYSFEQGIIKTVKDSNKQ
ncbi:UDP-glucose 4-epimerase [Vibrio maritimus]|uniref:UDP-glucose 4-epimerase n=1 Tax=Vibrio maritimus TaxID=990268 RepID=A0A090TC75_9VIBR|nr:UDP-glucose 4-epimerase [Vibrio maritimus]